jgi:V/A-type H+-transporting ATPase subunit G/H
MIEIIDRLLGAEAQAEAIVDEANQRKEALIKEAQDRAVLMEQQFEAGLDDLRSPYLREAEARASDAMAELGRKYTERQHMLRELAAEHESEAVDAAVALILDPLH